MRGLLTWMGIIVLGAAIGAGGAVLSIRASGLGSDVRIGPWTSGTDIGTVDADMRTRAIVALRGLLALPAREARYFTARTDSDGRPLMGNCTYAVTGPKPDARWWSITLYNREGWLVPTSDRAHSAGSGAFTGPESGFGVIVEPRAERPARISSGAPGPFELTLRTYRPRGAFAGTPHSADLPQILRGYCA